MYRKASYRSKPHKTVVDGGKESFRLRDHSSDLSPKAALGHVVSRVGVLLNDGTNGLEENGSLADDTKLGNELLKGKGRNGNHGQASVLEFLELHILLGSRVLGEETKRINTEVAGEVIGFVLAGFGNAVYVNGSRGDETGYPVHGADLAQSSVQKTRSTIVSV